MDLSAGRIVLDICIHRQHWGLRNKMSRVLRGKGFLHRGHPRGLECKNRGQRLSRSREHSWFSFSDCRHKVSRSKLWCLDFPTMLELQARMDPFFPGCSCHSIQHSNREGAKPAAWSDFPVPSVVCLGLELCLVLETGYFQYLPCDGRDIIIFIPDSQCWEKDTVHSRYSPYMYLDVCMHRHMHMV